VLILSRRQDETVVFPNLGVSVEVLRISGKTVRLGVKAPPQIRVLRNELAGGDARFNEDELVKSLLGISAHRLRNRLHKAGMALRLAEKLLEAGCHDDAEEHLAQALNEFQFLDREMKRENERPRPIPPRALVVEDDANESRLLAGFLKISGFQVDTASDGCDALDHLRSRHPRPDIVLLDMRMPRCNGPEMISALRRDPELEDLKVFAVSGTAPGEFGVSTGPGGVDRWFSKPVDPEELVAQMNRDLTTAQRPR